MDSKKIIMEGKDKGMVKLGHGFGDTKTSNTQPLSPKNSQSNEKYVEETHHFNTTDVC